MNNLNLPNGVTYCKKCTISNQRPNTSVEYKSVSATANKSYMNLNDDGVCDACKFAETKININWEARKQELEEVLVNHRKTNGEYDVLVPGSGGKDSLMAAKILKDDFNMNPLLVTWPPMLLTEMGSINFQAWLNMGFANITLFPNQKLHRYLTKQAFLNLLHPFQPFTIGQKIVAPKIALKHDIKLIFYGEHEAEYGSSSGINSSKRNIDSFSSDIDAEDLFLGGERVGDLIEDKKFKLSDFEPYIPPKKESIIEAKLEFHYLGYFIKWHPQEVYYYAVEHSDFQPNFKRTEGSYSRYSSIDDKMDWLHYYCRFIKFGMGRATNDSAQEIRNGDITRQEAINLVQRFDGEYPDEYLKECLEYMGITKKLFDTTVDSFRSDHLWHKKEDEWILRNPIWEQK
jgi:N-acetyl sugar amidotransferase